MVRSALALVLVSAIVSGAACGEDEPPAPEVPAIAWCEEVASWEPASASFEVEVVEAINARRLDGADCGSQDYFAPTKPLTMDAALRCAARKHTLDMIAADYFEHDSPDGQTYVERAALAEYEGEALAQTIAAGQREPDQVVATWMSNDGNCANLMNPEATELGVGYLPAPDDEGEVVYSHYWTLVFGH